MRLMNLFVLCLTIGIIHGANVCDVSDWSEWSECKSAGHEPTHFNRPQSWPVDKQKYDAARQTMLKMMKVKQQEEARISKCILDGSCPENMEPKSEGQKDCVNGMAGIYPCRNVDMLSHLNHTDLGFEESTRGNDMWVWHDTENDDDYAVVGTKHGSSFVRITDPYNPEVMGMLPTHTVPITWRDMKVVNDHAFIGSEAKDHGLQIFDMRQLRGLSHDSSRRFTNTAHYDGFGNSHNIVSNPETNLIIAVGCTKQTQPWYTTCDGGLHMLDVSDPVNPLFLGCYADDGYTHDAECVIYNGPDTRYTGKEICFCYNEDSVNVMDITDRANAVMLDKKTYEGSAYVHQGWMTPDFKYIISDDELDERSSDDKITKSFVWDITTLDDIKLVQVHRHIEESIDHNMYILDLNNRTFVYQSNYESGLRLLIFDEAQENMLEEVAYFDCYPPRTTANFGGTWSNYPWLKDGVVALNSMDYGLYMLLPNYNVIEEEYNTRKEYAERKRFRNIVDYTDVHECPAVVDVEECSME